MRTEIRGSKFEEGNLRKEIRGEIGHDSCTEELCQL